MIGDCVVDASVAIKLFVKEELSEKAWQLFSALEAPDRPRFYVPDLFFVECANVLWKYVRRFDYPEEVARDHLADLRQLALHNVATFELIGGAFPLAVQHGITVYDACYVQLALQLEVPLVSADETLMRRLDRSGATYRWLGDQ